jgi:hypothetical protein
MLYIAVVALTMVVLPAASVLADWVAHPAAPLVFFIGKWFVFWSVGVRLGLAGLRQVLQPAFTAREIFHLQSEDALPLVRELGIANIATAVVGLLSLVAPSFVVPVAISSGIFYGIAGVRHAFEPNRSLNENIAMISDLGMFLVLTTFLAATALHLGK